MKILNSNEFIHAIKDIFEYSSDRKICFVIGSGASIKAGIPSGFGLASKWFGEIKTRDDKNELNQWIKSENINQDDLAASYGCIYRKRFENDKASGYGFLSKIMRAAKPQVGHVLLAQILTRFSGHCVITTNFDSLIETAIYQFTDQTPLVCGHESLSGYTRPSNIHPLIIKIYRDLLLEPKSDHQDISKLKPLWTESLNNIFGNHIPVIIGYGGNDGSLMSYFEQMNKPTNFFWCGLNPSPESDRIKALIKKKGGKYVEIKGFDEIMYELLWVFDEIKPISQDLEDITKKRISAFNQQYKRIKYKKGKSKRKRSQAEISAFEYSSWAINEQNYDKRTKIYIEATEKFPKTSWLWNQFTYFLHFIKKDYQNTEKYYCKALEQDPNNANFNANYAIFLKNIKKDYQNSEIYYLKALEQDPKLVNTNCNYALFLEDIKKDYQNAEKYYLKALKLDPNGANSTRHYASFLANIKKDYQNAEKYYIKALEFDPKNPIANGNYAQLLFITNRLVAANKYLENAIAFNQGEKNPLLLELYFYKYAHDYESLAQSEKEVENLLKNGIQSINWDLSDNVRIGIEKGHPDPKKLLDLAKRITEPAK